MFYFCFESFHNVVGVFVHEPSVSTLLHKFCASRGAPCARLLVQYCSMSGFRRIVLTPQPPAKKPRGAAAPASIAIAIPKWSNPKNRSKDG